MRCNALKNFLKNRTSFTNSKNRNNCKAMKDVCKKTSSSFLVHNSKMVDAIELRITIKLIPFQLLVKKYFGFMSILKKSSIPKIEL